MRAEISVQGDRVTIAYDDGHTVTIDTDDKDSVVLRLHLGLVDDGSDALASVANVRKSDHLR